MRAYPISSLLFWQTHGAVVTKWCCVVSVPTSLSCRFLVTDSGGAQVWIVRRRLWSSRNLSVLTIGKRVGICQDGGRRMTRLVYSLSRLRGVLEPPVVLTHLWRSGWLGLLMVLLITHPALAGETRLAKGTGSCAVNVDGTAHTINLEYAIRISTNLQETPIVQFHLRWYPAIKQTLDGRTVLVPDRSFDRVLREAPLLRWQVFSQGQAVGWFTARFEGILPGNPGPWGIGIERRWSGWNTLFTTAKDGGTVSMEDARKWVLAGIELRNPELVEARFGKPVLNAIGARSLDSAPRSLEGARSSSSGILESMDQTWEKLEDRKKGGQ